MFFCYCWTLVGLLNFFFSFFLKNARRRPDTNGRGNVLFIWGIALSPLKWPRSKSRFSWGPKYSEIRSAAISRQHRVIVEPWFVPSQPPRLLPSSLTLHWHSSILFPNLSITNWTDSYASYQPSSSRYLDLPTACWEDIHAFWLLLPPSLPTFFWRDICTLCPPLLLLLRSRPLHIMLLSNHQIASTCLLLSIIPQPPIRLQNFRVWQPTIPTRRQRLRKCATITSQPV